MTTMLLGYKRPDYLYKIGYISNEDRYAKNKEENQLLFRIRAKK